MTTKDLISRMQCGEEIELQLGERLYFLAPDYSKKNLYWGKGIPPYPVTLVYDATENYYDSKLIFFGTTDEVLNYQFEGKYTLINDIDKFKELL